MTSTASDQLESHLASFEAKYPREAHHLREIVSSTPKIQSLFIEAIENDGLRGGIDKASQYHVENGYLGLYDTANKSININIETLRDFDADPTIANRLRITLGHELAHALEVQELKTNISNFDKKIDGLFKNEPPRDITEAFNEYINNERTSEARAEIAGINSLASYIKQQNPQASESELLGLLHQSTTHMGFYVDTTGSRDNINYQPKAGISFDENFQIENTKTNIDAFGKYFFDKNYYAEDITRSLIREIQEKNHSAVESTAKTNTSPLLGQSHEAVQGDFRIDLKALDGVDPGQIKLPPGFKDISGNGNKKQTEPSAMPQSHNGSESNNDHVYSWSSSDSSALSPVSNQLLQSGELWLRQVADQRGLPWGQGMQNTVAAMASKAREAGLTDITHLRVAPNDIHMAQFDGHTIREAHLNAHQAANTPQEQSREQLAQKDREAEHSEATARTADAPSYGALQAHAAPVRSM